MRTKHTLSLLLAGFFALITSFSFAQENQTKKADHHGAVNTREGIDQHIGEHLGDAYYYDFFVDGKNDIHYGFALPVILIDNGMHVFSSARFDHGKELVEINGQHYKLYKSKVYKTDSAGTIHLDDKGYPTNEKPWDFSITKDVFFMLFIAILMVIFLSGMAKSYRKRSIPGGANRFMEPLILFVRDEIAKPSIGPNYKKFMSHLLTVFFFILIMNLAGMIPFGANITGNITITFALSLVTFFITQFSGKKYYWNHIFWFPNVPIWVKIILIPIELLGIFTKPFALMMRLFANMSAGHVIIMMFFSLIVVFQTWVAGIGSLGFSIFLNLIHVLVAVLQAYVFTLLSALYFGMAVEDHSENKVDHSEDYPVV